jgi:hypothetical protein
MKEIIFKSDILSPHPSLKINKYNRHRTIFGGIVSILAFSLILTTAIYFTQIMLSRSEKSITYNVSPNENPSFEFSNMPFIFYYTNYLGFPIQNVERYFKTIVATWTIKQVNNSISTTPTFLNIEKCDINKHIPTEYKMYFENLPFLSEHLCIVPGQKIVLNNKFGSVKGFTTFSIYLQTCSNHTSLNITDCYDLSRIETELSGMYVNIKFPEHTFNHSNIDNPGNLYLRSEAIPVGPSVYKKEMYTIKQVEYTSDFGLIQQSKETKKYYYLSDNKETTDLSSEANSHKTFAYFQFTMDPKIESYLRVFMKAQTLLANIGGVIKGVLICCEILTKIFLKELYFIELLSALFNVDNKKMEEKMPNSMTIIRLDEGREKSDIPIQNFKPSNLTSTNIATQKIKKPTQSSDPRYFLLNTRVSNNDENFIPNTFNISLYNILAPFCILKKQSMKNKKENYLKLKKIIVEHLCIKKIIIRTHQVDKINNDIKDLYQMHVNLKFKSNESNDSSEVNDETSIRIHYPNSNNDNSEVSPLPVLNSNK